MARGALQRGMAHSGEEGSGWEWGKNLRDQRDISAEEAENSRQPEYISG